jgi:hypothetical protein
VQYVRTKVQYSPAQSDAASWAWPIGARGKPHIFPKEFSAFGSLRAPCADKSSRLKSQDQMTVNTCIPSCRYTAGATTRPRALVHLQCCSLYPIVPVHPLRLSEIDTDCSTVQYCTVCTVRYCGSSCNRPNSGDACWPKAGTAAVRDRSKALKGCPDSTVQIAPFRNRPISRPWPARSTASTESTYLDCSSTM